ncbi:hypothetical protein F4859DRAFT_528850 [Xylaria cf. heliscus]|nr:hypothetical protein F4859DRAFT_528850 [Xylaria cf. heliscus]
MLINHASRVLVSLACIAGCISAAVPNDYSTRKDACRQLAAKFPSKTFISGSSNYILESDSNIWSKTCVLDPSCVFTPSDEHDIASALGIIKATKTKFSIRSGGHMPVIGAQSNDNGVLIALTNIDTKQFNDDKSVISVGPGNHWIDVYNLTAQYGLAVVGGRYAQVGVGGLLTGGGINYFGNRVGWSCNTLTGAQVVLGNGSIVETSATSHPDLFWALKGGNNNYGIVTRFDLKTYPIGQVYAGGTVWDGEEVAQQVADAIQAFVMPGGGIDDIDTELNPTIEVHPYKDEQFFRSDYLPFVNGTFSTPPASIENFTSIPGAWYDTVSQRDSWVSLAVEVATVDNNLRREQFRALAVKIAPGVVDLAVDVILRPALASEKLREVNGSVVSVAFEPISQAMLQAAKDSGEYAIDLDPADGSFMILLIATNWFDAKWDNLMYSYSKNAADRFVAKAKALGVFHDFIYLNDAAGGQNPYATYGKGKSLPRMRKVQKAYDPEGVIKNLMTSGFKLN